MAPPSSLSGSRKRIKLQDEDDSRIKELESKLMEAISSNASLNTLADLTSLTTSLHEPHLALKAIYTCYRVFILLISKGCLENSPDEQAKVVRTWILNDWTNMVSSCDWTTHDPSRHAQTPALNILMSLLKHLSTSLSRSSPQPQFHVPHFKKVIDALLMCPFSERGGKIYLASPYVYSNVGFARGVPEHERVILPGNEGNGLFGYGPQDAVPDSIQVPLLNPLPQQGLDQPAAENLRRLASRYVNRPDSQVDMARMEPGSAGRYKVVIALEISALPCP